MENETQETQENLVLERSEGQNEASAANELAAIKAQLEEERQANDYAEEERQRMETTLAAAQSRMGALETALSEAKQGSEATAVELARIKGDRDEAIAQYLDMAKALNANIPEGIISGSTIDEIDQSIERGKGIVDAVKKAMEAEAAATKVPAGAPTRGAISLEGMSPREKIAYAISRQGRE